MSGRASWAHVLLGFVLSEETDRRFGCGRCDVLCAPTRRSVRRARAVRSTPWRSASRLHTTSTGRPVRSAAAAGRGRAWSAILCTGAGVVVSWRPCVFPRPYLEKGALRRASWTGRTRIAGNDRVGSSLGVSPAGARGGRRRVGAPSRAGMVAVPPRGWAAGGRQRVSSPCPRRCVRVAPDDRGPWRRGDEGGPDPLDASRRARPALRLRALEAPGRRAAPAAGCHRGSDHVGAGPAVGRDVRDL